VRRHIPRLSLLAVAIVAGVACADPHAAPETARLESGENPASTSIVVTAAASRVTVRNTTDSSVAYFLAERESLLYIKFAMCSDRSPRLAPGTQIAVPYDSIIGYSAQANAAAVMWCTMSRGRDGQWSAVGEMHRVDVRL
jgi:hypothetical protein